MKVFFSFDEANKHIKSGAFLFAYRRMLFPIWWNLTGGADWVIFTPGRCRREKPMPVFQRSSYATDLSCNVVCLFDPTLLVNRGLTLSWFVGDRFSHFADLAGIMVEQLRVEFGAKAENFLCYGTSGGGIPAIKIASHLGGSSVYVSNAQTDVRRYMKSAYNAMLASCFPRQDIAQIENTYAERFSCLNWDGRFNLYMSQNLADEHHFVQHFMPYVQNARMASTERQCAFSTYQDPDSGHDVLSRNIELDVINSILSGRSPWASLPRATVQ